MNPDVVLANATLVLPDRVVEHGWMTVSGGLIAEIGDGAPPAGARDCAGRSAGSRRG